LGDVVQRGCRGVVVQHPIATIRSFVDVRIDRVLWKLKEEDSFSVRELGELVWLVSHDNATRFLENIPESRKCRIRFEDLVTSPRQVMIRLCQSLNVELSEEMLQPYADPKKRMTDGSGRAPRRE
jgi:sulfotransferase family protein